MLLSKIKISNFRILKDFELDLQQNLSLIIGKNNCGKTSLLAILDKFLGKKKSTPHFAWNDFSLAFQDELHELIKNNKMSKGGEAAFSLGISLILYIEYNDTDDLSNLSEIMMDLEPETNKSIIEFKYSISSESFSVLAADFNGHLTTRKQQNDAKNFSKFMESSFHKYFKVSKHTIAFDYESNDAASEKRLIENDAIINKIINFKLINARRAVSNSETNNALSLLSSEYYKKIENNEDNKAAIDDFQSIIGETDQKFNEVYGNIFNHIVAKVEKFGGIRDGDSAIQIISSLQRRELLKGNTTVMYKHDNNCLLPENHNGLGYLNLIGMIFEIEVILSEFKKEDKNDERPADINLFFIEEPEAHTHPQLQYIFINNIKDILREGCLDSKGNELINMQSVITTHSSHIVSESEFDDIKYFYINDKYVQAKNLSDLEMEYEKDGDEGRQRFKFLKQYLTLNRAELFFADKAILIEGDTERILLPAMMKKIDQDSQENMPLLSQNISVVEVGAYAHIFDKFINFIGVKSLIITDLDPAKPNSSKHLCACKSSEATSTTNAALNFFFKCYQKGKKNWFTVLSALEASQKILIKNQDSWENSENGKVRIAFQTKENKYQARSFEDSFIHLNRKFINGNIAQFQSLKKATLFSDSTKGADDLASQCIGKKTSFALEILLASESDNPNKFYSNWEIPAYIKEGLEWLKK